MTERSVHSRCKFLPGQWQKEESAHPASSLRTSACAILTILKRDKRDLIIVWLELDALMPCSAVAAGWRNCPFEQRRTRRKFRDWNSVYRVFENCRGFKRHGTAAS